MCIQKLLLAVHLLAHFAHCTESVWLFCLFHGWQYFNSKGWVHLTRIEGHGKVAKVNQSVCFWVTSFYLWMKNSEPESSFVQNDSTSTRGQWFVWVFKWCESYLMAVVSMSQPTSTPVGLFRPMCSVTLSMPIIRGLKQRLYLGSMM